MSHVERVAHVLSPAPDSPLPFLGSALLLLGRIANSDGHGCRVGDNRYRPRAASLNALHTNGGKLCSFLRKLYSLFSP